jgi:hypothetical protein
MSLADPPPPSSLAQLPRLSLVGRVLHRVFRADRRSPWWFAGVHPGDDPNKHGRFDLPRPLGTCYLALTPIAAVLETLYGFDSGLLPVSELAGRLRAEVPAPRSAPAAANVTSPKARGSGATAALWAGSERRITQRWALALHRAGWRALHAGIAHDPTGRQRSVALFDVAGEHSPYGDHAGWRANVRTLHDDDALLSALARYGIRATRSDVDLPIVPLDESGLL